MKYLNTYRHTVKYSIIIQIHITILVTGITQVYYIATTVNE